MITGLNALNSQFVTSVDNIQAQLNQAELQLSSGYRVNQASDDPLQIADIFQSRANLTSANQTIQNLNIVQAQVSAGDSAIQSAIQVLDNAETLGLEGGGSPATATPAQQAGIASQVQGLISQMVAISRTSVDGVYIFSGDQSNSPAYQADPTSPNGVDRLITTQSATAQASDPTGVTFQVAQTAQNIFDQRDASDNFTANNVFYALQTLQNALTAGNSTAIAQAVDGIQTASAYLNQQAGFYGAAQNRISSAISLAQKFQVQDQSQLSTLEDTDVTAAAVQLTQATTALSAAMSAQAKQPTTSLFDYLPPY
jgi:flagellar hook-associated protein 3 FlgL